MLLVLACNPFGGDDEEASADNSEEVVEVNLERPSQDTATGEGQAEASQPDQPSLDSGESQDVDPAEATPEPSPAAKDSESTEPPAEPSSDETAVSPSSGAGAEEAIDLVGPF